MFLPTVECNVFQGSKYPMQTNVIHSDTRLNKHAGMFEGSEARSTAADLRKTRVSFAAY